MAGQRRRGCSPRDGLCPSPPAEQATPTSSRGLQSCGPHRGLAHWRRLVSFPEQRTCPSHMGPALSSKWVTEACVPYLRNNRHVRRTLPPPFQDPQDRTRTSNLIGCRHPRGQCPFSHLNSGEISACLLASASLCCPAHWIAD